jgi:hypothetical protein
MYRQSCVTTVKICKVAFLYPKVNFTWFHSKLTVLHEEIIYCYFRLRQYPEKYFYCVKNAAAFS